MVDFECSVLLHQINTKLKGTKKSYALLGNGRSLQLFHNTGSEVIEMCHCTAKPMKSVLTTILNAITTKEENK